MVVTRKRIRPELNITVNGSVLQQVDSIKYLGVLIASDLSWGPHIDILCSKAKKQLGVLHRHFHSSSPRVLLRLYKSLVLPTLDYCSSLWDPHFAIHSNKLESIQTFAIRIITKSWRGSTSVTQSRFNLPSLSTRRRKQKVALCYRVLNNLSVIPPSFFTLHPSPHLRHNHSLPLYYPPVRSIRHLSSFSVSTVPLWNSLPPDLVVSSPSQFKQRLK